MKKFSLALLTVLLLLMNLPALSASAAELQLYDPGVRLSSDDYNEASVRLHQTVSTIDMNVVVIIGNEARTDTTIESMTSSTYDQLYGTADGICFYFDLSNAESPYDFYYTSGLARFYYTDSDNNNRIKTLVSEVQKHFYPKGSEDVLGAMNELADQLELYYQQGIPENYYVQDDAGNYQHVEGNQIVTTDGKPYIDQTEVVEIVVISFVIGLIAAIITNASVKSHYKFMRELSPTNYINKRSVNYIEQSDRFIRERVTKTPINSDSGSGGGSSGSHSSGGFHR